MIDQASVVAASQSIALFSFPPNICRGSLELNSLKYHPDDRITLWNTKLNITT